MGKAIVVTNISKTYHSGGETVKALDGVSLEVREGEIFGLLGPNGAGKTSLISILAGILTPDGGTAEIFGIDCARDTKSAQKLINVVSGFTGVLFSLSVEEALMYYCLLYGVKNPKAKIDSVIKTTNLENARKLEAEDLSSGMKQRYLIAKGILNEPRVLILDEPTVGLDVESAIIIRDMVRKLRKEGHTILLTTHNMFEAEELCDRIAFINRGKIIDIGTVASLKEKIVGKRIIEVNCSDAAQAAKALSGIKGVEANSLSGKLVHVSVDSYIRMKEIMKVLSTLPTEIYNVSALEPTLEETYLKIMNGRRKRSQPLPVGEELSHIVDGQSPKRRPKGDSDD
ncbi:MAG TPA: ABC transporter ATP-binding protein [Candidatus Bilamarchaeum sp.]|nr:ABC transporter ATP-binding protein [Candidatus Bilamarchaeum sp.]